MKTNIYIIFIILSSIILFATGCSKEEGGDGPEWPNDTEVSEPGQDDNNGASEEGMFPMTENTFSQDRLLDEMLLNERINGQFAIADYPNPEIPDSDWILANIGNVYGAYGFPMQFRIISETGPNYLYSRYGDSPYMIYVSAKGLKLSFKRYSTSQNAKQLYLSGVSVLENEEWLQLNDEQIDEWGLVQVDDFTWMLQIAPNHTGNFKITRLTMNSGEYIRPLFHPDTDKVLAQSSWRFVQFPWSDDEAILDNIPDVYAIEYPYE